MATTRTIPYAIDRDALYRPHLGRSIFPTAGDLSEELLAAEAARLAYKRFETSPEERGEVETALRSVGFEELAFFNRGGSQGFAAASPERKVALVSFRGTEKGDPLDLGADAQTLSTAWAPGGRVHAGFARYLDLLWTDTEAWLAAREGRLILAGHSLGAGLATLAASRLASRRETLHLVTFGSPRVGNAAFIQTLSGIEVSRYVDCCDLVTHLPPEALGFQHVEGAAFFYIDRFGEVHREPSQAFLGNDGKLARTDYLLHHAWKNGSVAVRDLADHAPINYVEPLRRGR